MSDLTFGGWQRRAARAVDPTVGHGLVGDIVRSLLRRPVRVGGVLAVVLAALVAADLMMASGSSSPTAQPAEAGHAAAVADSVAASQTSARASGGGKAPAAWLDVVKPIETFSLESSEFGKAAKLYRARRHAEGGGRQDTIILGTTGSEPALRLSLYRRGTEPYNRVPFFSDVARQAADAGLAVTRSGLPDLLPTRFGALEVADISLNSSAAIPIPCSGFRLVLDAPALTLVGLACGTRTAMSRRSLQCVLERLDLASGGTDKTLVEFFAMSELRRTTTCAGTRLAPDQVHAGWLDDRSATPRRNTRRR